MEMSIRIIILIWFGLALLKNQTDNKPLPEKMLEDL